MWYKYNRATRITITVVFLAILLTFFYKTYELAGFLVF
nr:MAG TPA: hypothetical protein [Caudoviricetes sp.]